MTDRAGKVISPVKLADVEVRQSDFIYLIQFCTVQAFKYIDVSIISQRQFLDLTL